MLRSLHYLYTAFFSPRQQDEDIRNRELVLNVLLAGTLLILALAVFFLIASYFAGRTFVLPRAVALSLVFFIVLGIYRLSRQGRYRLAAWLLMGVYFMLAAAVGAIWSIALPSAVLLYGLVVVMTGILLGPRYTFMGFVTVVLLMTVTTILGSAGIIHYDLTWKQHGPETDDVFGLSFMLGMIAAISWLFNNQMAHSLYRAQRAETALTKQKDLLETTVEKRTQQLQAAQLEKIQQMYRFAELGQLSTALLHELANHLTTLTIDIEGLEGNTRSTVLTRAKRSIRYLDDMVVRVRDQLHGNSNIRSFNVVGEVEEVVTLLRHKAQAANVQLKWEAPADKKSLRSRGEPIRLRQLIANLISNAIDAYDPPKSANEKRDVLITVNNNEHGVRLTVSDWGRGIPKEDRPKLFEPFFSTKQTGMGMGLYIVKQIAEEHFLGSVAIDESKNCTTFVVTLPKADI